MHSSQVGKTGLWKNGLHRVSKLTVLPQNMMYAWGLPRTLHSEHAAQRPKISVRREADATCGERRRPKYAIYVAGLVDPSDKSNGHAIQ